MLSLLTAVVVVAADTAAVGVVVVAAVHISAVAAAHTSGVAVHISVVAVRISVVAVHNSGVDTVVPDGSRRGMAQAHPSWLGAQPDLVQVSRQVPGHS